MLLYDVAGWLNYIELHFQSGKPRELQQVINLAQQLNCQAFDSTVITVTGTNGKGSVCRALEALLLANHKKVAVYTSPHLIRFNERIRINGHPASDQALIHAFTTIMNHQPAADLSYFDIITLAALLIFKQQALDVIILEVGVGGRLDACNIVDNDISVITNIALDHQQWLGPDRDAIAKEKAAIMRAGKVVVVGDEDPPAVIAQYAQQLGVALYRVKQDFDYHITASHWSWITPDKAYSDLPLSQLATSNLAITLMVWQHLKTKVTLSDDVIKTVFAQLALAGRCEFRDFPCNLLLDVAHNPAACHHLSQQLKTYQKKYRLIALVAMASDKDHAQCFKPFLAQIDAWHVCEFTHPRVTKSTQLLNVLRALNVNAVTKHQSVQQALAQLLQEVRENDLIVVFGSFYLLAEVLIMIDGNYSACRWERPYLG